nr:PREDICTED: transmembrane protease serine 4-like isoform X1 [Latimeria chalumnae]|eukprot:XP_005987307.2 PREDICTED: transmembrane protease serine 4-like isoform X1 [Latimeria chalumnae]
MFLFFFYQSELQYLPENERPLNPAAVPRTRTNTPKAMISRRKQMTIGIVVVVVAALVVAAVLIKVALDTYYFFCTKSFKFIPLQSKCDGTVDCQDAEDEKQCVMSINFTSNYEVQITSPNSILQVYSPRSQMFRMVCYDNWNDKLAKIACDQLGYSKNPVSTSVVISSNLGTQNFSVVNPSKGNNPAKIQSVLEDGSCVSGATVSLTCSDCGHITTDRIVGGTDTQIESWPWQVSLQYNEQHTCGGIIINPRWIVTAAHCFPSEYDQTDHWKVIAGISILSSSNGVPVAKVYTNGLYDSIRNDNDIALIKLKLPLTFSDSIKPACLPNYKQTLVAGSRLWVTGWGYTKENGVISNQLQEAELSFIDLEVCNSNTIYGGQITKNMLCAGYLKGGTDACQGDSGGPLVYNNNKQWQLVGIVSWGSGCARKNKPGVYCNVEKFLDWIYYVMQQECST